MYEIEINDDAVVAALDRIAGRLDDMTGMMDEIGQALVMSSKARIDRGVTPEGVAFAPRSQVTLDRYAALDKAPKGGPLKLTGDMQGEIFHQVGQSSVEVGSNAIQAAVMQFGAAQGAFGTTARGGKIPWGAIPARPFLGISDEDSTDIVTIVDEWLEGLLQKPD